jgi:predicted RNA-binding protein
MCLSKAYLVRNGDRELLLEEVASVGVEGDKLLFKTLFGEQKKIGASIREIDFMTHTILLENPEEKVG